MSTRTAAQILEALTQELNMAMTAADPHGLDEDYVEWMCEGTEGCIGFDHWSGEFFWNAPTDAAMAARIEATHPGPADESEAT